MISMNVRGPKMGGWGSGRTSYRSLVEDAVTLNLPLMIGRGWIRDGLSGAGKLRLSTRDGQLMPIRLSYDLTYPYEGWLDLRYCRLLPSEERLNVKQRIQLKVTEPHFGGRRWWMI